MNDLITHKGSAVAIAAAFDAHFPVGEDTRKFSFVSAFDAAPLRSPGVFATATATVFALVLSGFIGSRRHFL